MRRTSEIYITALLDTLLLFILILINNFIPLEWIIGFIIVVLILNFILVLWRLHSYHFRPPVDRYLELILEILWGKANAYHYRINVMLYSKIRRRLTIKYHYNMIGHTDIDIKFKRGIGAAGKCFEEKNYIALDFNKDIHEDYFVRSDDVWNKMLSLLTTPLKDEKGIIGVLNIDSELSIENTHFNEEKIYKSVASFAYMIKRML